METPRPVSGAKRGALWVSRLPVLVGLELRSGTPGTYIYVHLRTGRQDLTHHEIEMLIHGSFVYSVGSTMPECVRREFLTPLGCSRVPSSHRACEPAKPASYDYLGK